MDMFTKYQQTYDEAVATLLATEDASAFDMSNYGKLVEEYGKLLKQYRHYRDITDTSTHYHLNSDEHGSLSNAHFDVLTGIFNRRYLLESLDRIIMHMSRNGDTLSMLMVDIDYFKQYNDHYGQDAGDNCLRYIAEALKATLFRGNDFVARCGGEEFMAVLPTTDEDGARLVAGRMIEQIKSLEIPHTASPTSNNLTVSIGVVTGVNNETRLLAANFLKRADEALYQAKDRGRNQYAYLGLHT